MGFSPTGGNISGADDVAISNAADNQVLTYDGTVQLWRNENAPSAPVVSVAGKTGAVTLVKADVGLGNVDNTSDANKPVSTATQTALAAKANDTAVVHTTGDETVAGIKTFSSSPVVPTPTTGTQAANKSYVDAAAGGGGLVDPTTTKGDIMARTSSALTRLGVGTDGQVLTADSAQTTGIRWQTVTGGSGDAATPYGRVFLDDYAGADDDAKLTAALTEVSADTYPRTITLRARAYTFTTANRVAFTGLRIEGPPGYGNPERGQTKMPSRVTLSMSGPWFINPLNTDVFSVSFHQLSFTGGSSASLIGQNGSGTWYCLSMRDIYSSGLRTVIGTQATKVLMTAASFTGDWEINNCYNGAFHMGGSDNVFWSDGMLLDSGTAFNTAGSATGQYHIWFDYMQKSHIGPLYITAEGPWAGIRISGGAYNSASSNIGGPLSFYGIRLEGRNTNQPSDGSLVRVEGGYVNFRDCWFGFAMQSPASQGHTPQDAGVIHVMSSGAVLVDGCTYTRATGVAETVPFIYSNSTAPVRVRNIWGGETWSGLPRVQQAAGSGVNGDGSVTII